MKLTRADVAGLPWRGVSSSNLRRAAFRESGVDEEGAPVGEVFVEFTKGTYYRYLEVSPRDFDALLAADSDPRGSVGRTFHRTIRSTYAHESIEIEEDDGDHDTG